MTFAFRITTVYLNNYLQHCISHTAVHTNDTDSTEQVGVVRKKFRLQRIKCVRFGEIVFVFVLQRLNMGILC